MPILLRVRGYVFLFRSSDGGEPPHVHVIGNEGRAKIWLTPEVGLARRGRYSKKRIDEIIRITTEHREEWLDAWSRFFER